METGAVEGGRAGDHVCPLVTSPSQLRAWPKHSLLSGWLGDPRQLCLVPPGHHQRASEHPRIKKSWLGKKSEQEEPRVFPSSHFTLGETEACSRAWMLWSERSRFQTVPLWFLSSTTSQLYNLGQVVLVL